MSSIKSSPTYSTIIDGECPKCGAFQEFSREQRKGEEIVCLSCGVPYTIDQVKDGNTFDGKTWGKLSTTQELDDSQQPLNSGVYGGGDNRMFLSRMLRISVLNSNGSCVIRILSHR